MEYFGMSRTNLSCAHWGPHGPEYSHLHSIHEHKVPDPTTYHTYGLAWTGHLIGFYIDRRLVHTCSPPHPPFCDLEHFHLILNVAMGGNPFAGKRPARVGEWELTCEWVRQWEVPPGGWDALRRAGSGATGGGNGKGKKGGDVIKQYLMKLTGKG
jgi:beta-glucanase (GH16 family)